MCELATFACPSLSTSPQCRFSHLGLEHRTAQALGRRNRSSVQGLGARAPEVIDIEAGSAVTVGVQAGPGWYADPTDAGRLRWFDGGAWTEHLHAIPEASGYAAQGYQTAAVTWPAQQGAAYGTSAYATPATGCRVCGATPALAATLREHHGMVIVQQFVTYTGPWCRDCGLVQFRHAQRRTLLLGWWGLISFFVNFANVVQNLHEYSRLTKLGMPGGRVRAPLRNDA